MSEDVAGVALRTIQVNMRTGEGETGLGMVEARRQPGIGSVALAAILTKLTIVGIVLGVAGKTRGIQGREDVIDMALRASQGGMGAGQRELGFSMVKCGRQPGGSVVAGVTVGAELPVVRIVFSVAGVTGRVEGGKDVVDMAL